MKLDCLLLRHIQSLIFGTTAKWRYFAIYWIGLYLRKYNSNFVSLNIPHSDEIPPFYKRCLDLLRNFETKASNIKISNLSCKQFYRIISNIHTDHPRIESVHPKIDFRYIWSSLQDKFTDPFTREISWRAANEVLPVQKLLCRYKISNISKCTLCDYLVESLEHLFYFCPVVALLYDIVFDWIPAVADVRRTDIPMSSSLILHYVLPANIRLNKFQNSDFLYLLCECKYVVWSCRNLKKFENRKVNGNFMAMFLLSRLKLRIRSDLKKNVITCFFQILG